MVPGQIDIFVGYGATSHQQYSFTHLVILGISWRRYHSIHKASSTKWSALLNSDLKKTTNFNYRFGNKLYQSYQKMLNSFLSELREVKMMKSSSQVYNRQQRNLK